jgi:alpha-L-rhamnosidase
LKRVRGSIPHPKGTVAVSIEPRGSGWNINVTLPSGVSGEFQWFGMQPMQLQPGANRFDVAA